MDDMHNAQGYLQSLQEFVCEIQDRVVDLERRCDVSKDGFLDTWLEERLAQMNTKSDDKSNTGIYSDENAKENSGNPFPNQIQMEADASQCEASKSSNFKAITDVDYKLGESVWDTSILLWLAEIGFSSSCFLAGVLALNMFIQGFMSYALLTTEEFVNSDRMSEVFDDMEKWRLIDGHNLRYIDLQEVSLVSRVCNVDWSLSVASGQLQLIEEINSYLSLGLHDFDEAGKFSRGQLLCMLCILLLALVVMREFRQSVYFLLCISTLPHSRTQLKEGSIEGLSWPRLICTVILICARMSVSAAILISGVCWLGTTSDMGSLILNAAALGFILDIDEILFSSVVPAKVAQTMNTIEPLRFSAKLYLMDAMLPALCAILALIVAHQGYIAPNSATLLDIKGAICAGGQRFAVTYNSETGMSTSRGTQRFMSEVTAETHPAMMAVREIRDSPPWATRCGEERWSDAKEEEEEEEVCTVQQRGCAADTDHGMPIKSIWTGWHQLVEFELNSKSSVVEWSSFYDLGCEDLQYHPEGYDDQCDFIAILDAVRHQFFEHGSPSAHFQCSDYQQFCDLDQTSHVLKAICPVTCGCDNPLSGLFRGALGGRYDGCPTGCREARQDKLKSVPCSDISTESDDATIAGWQRYWEKIAQTYSYWRPSVDLSEVPDDCESAFALLEELNEGIEPCTPIASTDDGSASDREMRREGKSSIVAFCPAYCCNSSGVCIPQCPQPQ